VVRKPAVFPVVKQDPPVKLAEKEVSVFQRMTHDRGVDFSEVDRALLTAAIHGCVASGWMFSIARNSGLPGIRLTLWIESTKHVEYAGTTADFETLLRMVVEAANGNNEDYLAHQRSDARPQRQQA